jgi:hypothetical protein
LSLSSRGRWTTPCGIAARGREGEVQRIGDVAGTHGGAELPRDDEAAVVVEDHREVEPTPADDFEMGEVGLPELVRARRLLGEYVTPPHHDEGRAGDQVMRLEQAIEFKVTKPNDFLSVAGQTEETLRQPNQDSDTLASCCHVLTRLAYDRYTFRYNQSWRIIHATIAFRNKRTAVCCQYGHLPFLRFAENTRGGKGKCGPFWYCEDFDACSVLWVPAKVCEGSRNTTLSDADVGVLSVG